LSKSICVLWCCHASTSSEVSTEIDLALHFRKRIVPYVLCGAPRKACLEEWQHASLRGVAHACLSFCQDDVAVDSILLRELMYAAQLTSLEPDAVERRAQARLREGFQKARQRVFIRAAMGFILVELIVIAPLPPAPSRRLSLMIPTLAAMGAAILFASASLLIRHKRRANAAFRSGYLQQLLAILIDALIRLVRRAGIGPSESFKRKF
jgi:hypothetical protein